MAVQFTSEVAFYGIVALASTANTTAGTLADADTPILSTGGSVSVNHEPIFSTGVWGAGWYNAAENVAYSMNSMRIEGDVSYELVAGNVFNSLLSFGFTNRAALGGTTIKVLPQGTNGYTGAAWCSGVSFDGSQGANVTGSFNYASGNMETIYWNVGGSTTALGSKLGVGGHPSGTTPAVGDKFNCMYPYWASGIKLGTIALADVINWSANYTSEVNFLTLCSGRNVVPTDPDYIMVGSMSASGSFTVLGVNGQLSPDQFHQQKSCVISMAPGNALATPNTISFANIVYTSGSTAVQTGGSYITADISFTAMGDGANPPMLLA